MDDTARRIGRQGGSAVAQRADHVQQAAEHRLADRHTDRREGREDRCAPGEPRGCLQCDSAHSGFPQVAVHLEHQQLRAIPVHDERGVDRRQIAAFEGHVDDGTTNGGYGAEGRCGIHNSNWAQRG